MERIIVMGDYFRAENERLTLFESREEFDKAFCEAFNLTDKNFKELKEKGIIVLTNNTANA